MRHRFYIKAIFCTDLFLLMLPLSSKAETYGDTLRAIFVMAPRMIDSAPALF